MAYSRFSRTSRFKRRPVTARRKYTPTRRSYRRKSYGRRRIGKRYAKRPTMTRRRILNVSTRKKTDTMLTGIGAPDTGIPLTQSLMNAANPTQYFISCMTFMARAPGAEDHTRRSNQIFYKGWVDNYRIYIGGGAGWVWRRIVFSSTERIEEAELPANITNGYMRGLNKANLPDNPPPDEWLEQLFVGRRTLDWTDVMTAAIDRQRTTVHSDILRRMNPGNDSGKEVSSRLWTPVGRNLRYDDDEYADEVKPPAAQDSSPWVSRKGGSPGNVYVVDFFDSMAEDAAESLALRIESKRYWHER